VPLGFRLPSRARTIAAFAFGSWVARVVDEQVDVVKRLARRATPLLTTSSDDPSCYSAKRPRMGCLWHCGSEAASAPGAMAASTSAVHRKCRLAADWVRRSVVKPGAVVFDRQEASRALLGGELKNHCEVWTALRLKSTHPQSKRAPQGLSEPRARDHRYRRRSPGDRPPAPGVERDRSNESPHQRHQAEQADLAGSCRHRSWSKPFLICGLSQHPIPEQPPIALPAHALEQVRGMLESPRCLATPDPRRAERLVDCRLQNAPDPWRCRSRLRMPTIATQKQPLVTDPIGAYAFRQGLQGRASDRTGSKLGQWTRAIPIKPGPSLAQQTPLCLNFQSARRCR